MLRLTFFIAFHSLIFSLHALDVVIIGGGPAGLATAIEAHYSGADVIIVEKRNVYNRAQLLFLFDYSLGLFEKWAISIPTIQIASLEDRRLMGSTRIQDLEKALAKRVNELGIRVLEGEFLNLRKSEVVISTENGVCQIPYDILVGADGVHSGVRDAIHVPCNVLGKAISIAAFIPFEDPIKKAEMLPAIFQDELFVKRIFFPEGRVFILQYPLDTSKTNVTVDLQALVREAQKAGWLEEAESIAEGKSFITSLIPVVLQQAHTFSNGEKSVLLVGDAAAAAPYCQAMGANTALKTAEIAGIFFAQVIKDKNHSYSQFNEQMKEVTDALIDDSAYLIGQFIPL